jgi:hypothetical protein
MTVHSDQQLRREANDNRRLMFGANGRLIVFVCECEGDGCRDSVLLTAEDFDAKRPGLVMLESHPLPQPAT